jgi:hypothetical protein
MVTNAAEKFFGMVIMASIFLLFNMSSALAALALLSVNRCVELFSDVAFVSTWMKLLP